MDETGEHIFQEFYMLNSNAETHAFIASTTYYGNVKRRWGMKGKESTNDPKWKQSSIAYYFTINGNNVRVCRSYYLGILAVSQKMVFNVHKKKDLVSGAIKPDKRGHHGNQRKISKEELEAVTKHIKAFKVVEAHYCCAKTSKEYL